MTKKSPTSPPLSNSDLLLKLRHTQHIFHQIPISRGLNNYPYSTFSLTDYFPPLNPNLVEDIADLIIRLTNFTAAHLIISEADRGGGPITHAVATRVNLPYILTNWYATPVPQQIVVKANVGFSGKGYICLNGNLSNKSFIFVDDLLSSGGTATAILEAAQKSGGKPLAAIFVGEKVDQGGRAKLNSVLSIPIISLVKFTATDTLTQVDFTYIPPFI